MTSTKKLVKYEHGEGVKDRAAVCKQVLFITLVGLFCGHSLRVMPKYEL